jgi:hypothetical protein
MSIQDEFPPETELHLDSVLADAYTRLRARAIEMERERDRYQSAITACLDWANGRQSEWGERAEKAFAFLDAAIYPPAPEPHQTKPCPNTN